MPMLEQAPHVLNQHVCVLTCKSFSRYGNQLLCIHNGLSIQTNANSGLCPHPHGNQFKGANQVISHINLDWWGVVGPLLWRELHRWTLTAHLINDQKDWLRNFLSKIACGECKDHAIKWMASHPPDFTSHVTLFLWGVNFHNSVNERLPGKTQWTVEEAMKRWGTDDRPAPRSRGCGQC